MGTHGGEQGLHVLVGVRDRGQVDQVPVQDLLVPAGQGHTVRQRARRANPTQRPQRSLALQPSPGRRGPPTTPRDGAGKSALWSRTGPGRAEGPAWVLNGILSDDKMPKDPKTLAKGEASAGLFRECEWGGGEQESRGGTRQTEGDTEQMPENKASSI